MKIPHLILPALLCCLSASVAAQIKFSTEAPSAVDVNDAFRVRYSVNTDDASEFVEPDFKDFEVLNGPARSSFSNFQMINGKTSSSSSITYTYMLSPKKKGTFTIPGAAVTVGGKTYRSNAVTIAVTGGEKKAPSQRHQAEDRRIQAAGTKVTHRDLFFTVTANKKKVYEQEPIVLTYKFHSKLGVGLANLRLRRKPDLKGFLAQEVTLPADLSPVTEELNGDVYRVGTNLQYVLFPQQHGKLSVPGITFDCEVIQRDMNMDAIDAFFNGAGSISLNVQRTTPEMEIEVLPLPSPRPAGFSGGVGKMEMQGELLTDAPRTNDLCTYRITVSGSGNLKLIKAPTLEFPKDFDVYPPKTTDNTGLTAEGLTGKVVFDYTFVPLHVGTYTLPAAEFIYFDTATDSYVTLKTEPITLNVEQGHRTANEVRQELELRDSDIRPPHFGKSSAHSPFLPAWGSWAYWLLHVALLLIFFLGCRGARKYIRSHADLAGRRHRRAARLAEQRLKKARLLLAAGNASAFHAEVEHSLWQYAEDKFGIGKAERNKEMLKATLPEKGLSASVVSALVAVMEECEFARFAPDASGSRDEQILEQALAAINRIENELKTASL